MYAEDHRLDRSLAAEAAVGQGEEHLENVILDVHHVEASFVGVPNHVSRSHRSVRVGEFLAGRELHEPTTAILAFDVVGKLFHLDVITMSSRK